MTLTIIRSTSRIEHVMDCILNQAKSRTELIHTIHTNIHESFPRWKALGIPFIAHAHSFAGKTRSRSHTTATCYTTFQKHQLLLLLPMLTNICVVLHFLKNDRCGFYFHSLNRICSGTTEIERWIRENDISRNDRSRFHCISKLLKRCQRA
jgi:hypothetical protein